MTREDYIKIASALYAGDIMKIGEVTCHECGRVFDLWIKEEAEEWLYGHDCEEEDSDND